MKETSYHSLQPIRLLERETIELLKATLEEPPVCRMEELLHCAYLDENLNQISPHEIIELRESGEKEILKRSDSDTIRTPCVIVIDGNAYIARLDISRKDGTRSLKIMPDSSGK